MEHEPHKGGGQMVDDVKFDKNTTRRAIEERNRLELEHFLVIRKLCSKLCVSYVVS